MNKYLYRLIFSILTGLIFHSGSIAQTTPLSANGQLKLVGLQLSNECGKPVQLRGMSSHGLQWFGNCINTTSLDELANVWGIDVIRAAMYVNEGGYTSDPAGYRAKVDQIATWAEQRGIYCIIDWHILTPGDPNSNMADAKTFFDIMAQKYAGKKHIIYEICNEPNGVAWSTIKSYAETIIPIIRKYDKENIIIVGTPEWSGKPGDVVGNAISAANNYNVMYTFHFYAGSHYTQTYMDGVIKQIPIFATEWGVSSASGNGGDDYTNAQKWIDLFNGGNTAGIKVSWCNWSFSDKGETSAALNSGACGGNNYKNLSTSGTWVKARISSPADNFQPCAGISVTLTASPTATNYFEGDNITLTATATGATITKIDFYDGNTLLGTDASSPYTFAVNGLTSGSHQFKAVATSSTGTTGTSTLTINVIKAVFQTASAPTIDGTIDASWGTFTTSSIGNLLSGTITTSDLSGQWRASWDNTNLYVLVEITDDVKKNDAGTDTYNDDEVEIYVDINNNKLSTYGTDDYQYTFRWNDATLVRETHSKSVTGIVRATANTGTGYVTEVKIPWSTMAGSPAVNQLVGFDVMVNDDDDGGARDAKIAWGATTDDAWQNPSVMGTIVLKGLACTAPGAAGTITGSNTVCAGATNTTYSIAAVSGATSYNWTLPTGATITAGNNTNSITVTMGSTSGTVSVTPVNSCGNGTAATLNVTVNASVAASVTVSANNTTICSGASVNLTATPANGGSAPTYQWQKNGTNISGATQSTYTATGITSGDQFKVVMTSNAACVTGSPATSSSVSITVNPSVAASVTASASSTNICSGQSVTFTATPTNGGTAPTYQWQKNNVNIAGATASTYTTTTAANNDQYKVIMTSNANCVTGSPATSASTTITVTSSAAASVTVSSSATTICSGQNITLTATPVNGGSAPTYQWMKNSVNIAGATNSTYSTTAAANNDKFSVKMTSSLACATGSPATSAVVTITVNPSVAASVAASSSSTSICSGQSITLTATPTNGGTTPTYQWQKNNVNIAGATAATYTTTTAANNDQYKVIMTSNAACVTGSPATSGAVTITVNPSAAASVTASASSTSICSGQSITFTASPTNGGTAPAYQWQKNNVNIAGATAATYTTTTAVNNDQFKVIMTSNASCVTGSPATSNSVSITVSSSAAASVTASSSATTICSGQNITLTANPVNGGTTPGYQWMKNGVNIAGATASSYSTATAVNNDQFSVKMTSSLSCATGSPATSAVVTITVNPSVAASVTASASSTNICSGQSITFTASPTNGGTTPTYQWQKNNVNIAGATAATYTTTSATNNDQFKVIMTSNASCVTGSPATSNSIAVTVNSSAAATVTVSSSGTTICSGQNITLTASPVNGGTTPSYQWMKNGANIAGATASTYSTSAAVNNDKFSVKMTSSLACATGSPATSNQVTITVGSSLTASVTAAASSNTVCAGQQVTLTATPSNGGNAPTYQWLKNGANISGATASTYSTSAAANNDQFSVIMTSNASCVSNTQATSNAVSITVSSSSTAGVAISGNTVVCTGQTITLTASPTNGGTSPAYQWKKNNTNIAGATTGTYSTTSFADGDQFSVSMTSNASCVTGSPASSNTLTISSGSAPVAPGAISGPNSVCATKGGFSYSIQPVSGATGYNWSLPSGAIITSGAGTTAITVTFGSTSGNISVTATNSCGTGSSTTLAVTVIPTGTSPCASPEPSTITGPSSVNSGQTSVSYSVPSNAGSTYTWTVPQGATIVSGQGTNAIVVDFGNASGDICVTESNSYGSITSCKNIVINQVSSVFNTNGNSIILYPNPYTEKSIIEFISPNYLSYSIQVLDMNGRICQEIDKAGTNESIYIGDGLKAGVYVVQVRLQNEVLQLKLVKAE